MFVPANRVKVAIPTTGTASPIDLGSAVVGFQSLAAAGVADTDQIRYIIEDGAAWELSSGTVSDTVSKVTRTVLESSNGGAAINLSGNAVLYVVFAGEDVVQPGQLATVATTGAYADLTGIPLSFNPQTHNHDIEDVTGLQTALDGKAATSHTHTVSQITDFPTGLLTAAGTATLTNKTYSNSILDGSVREEIFTVTGTSPVLNPANGTIQIWDTNSTRNPTFSMSNGESFTLIVFGSGLINWPMGVSFVGGSSPTLTGADMISFVKLLDEVVVVYVGTLA